MSEKTQEIIKYGVVGLFCVIFLSALWMGIIAGRNKSASFVVANNFKQTQLALDYFYKDQGRYPTVEEFKEKGSFGLYLSQPLSDFSVSGCKELINYSILPTHQPQLTSCLSSSSGSYNAGINSTVLGGK